MEKLLYWIPALILATMIACFSMQSFSQQDLSPRIQNNQWLIKTVQQMPRIQFNYKNSHLDSHTDQIKFIQFIIRKTAHLTLYGLLGLFLLYALKNKRKIKLKHYLFAAVIVLSIATADEINQLYSLERTGCKEDIILDFTGYLLFSLLDKLRTLIADSLNSEN